MFQTLIHPTDFDEPSKEAFRVARSLAGALGARVIAFHVVPPAAAVTQDGRVILGPHAEPIDLWAEYRALQAETPKVPVHYAVVVADESRARRLLQEQVRELGEGVLVVMVSHGRRGLSRLLWGAGEAEEVVRDCPCPVLVVKAPPPKEPAREAAAEAVATA